MTILPRPLDDEHGEEFSSVVANDTNMVYGTSAPLESDLTFTPPKGLLESDDMYVALAYTNEYESLSTLDLGDYEGMVSTNKAAPAIVITNRTTGVDVTANYAITFRPGTLTVEAAGLAVTAVSITNCYDKTAHRLADYTVTDRKSGESVTPTAISNSVDGVTWYLKDDFPYYVNVTDGDAPVYVAVVADNYETFVSEGPLATVTVTQKVVTVTLNDTNKVYGAETPDWTVKNVEGLVDGDYLTGVPGVIEGDEPTDASDEPYEVTVGVGTLSAGDNYTIVVRKPTITITRSPIQAVPEGDDPDDPTKPWAQATSVECFIDEIPEGGSTNIIVTCGGFFGDDLNKTNVVYTTPGGWSEIGVYTNWCTVSCEPNYLPTNLMATVRIKEREGDVEGDTEPENAEEIAEEMKDAAKAAGEIIRETTGEDPIYVEVRLVMNSTNNLPQAEQERTAQDAKKLEEKFGKDYSDYENVKGECVDIKLELTTDPDRVDWTNIGSNNDVMVDIELKPDCALDEIVAIYRCHYSGSKVSYDKITESSSKPSKTSTEERWWRNRSKGVVHLHVKKFSLFEIFTGDKVTPSPPVNPCGRKDPVNEGANVYQLQMQLRSTWGIPCSSAVTAELCGRSNPGVSSVIRIPASFVVNAWLYNCTNACWTLENSSIVAWEQNRAKFFSQPAITWDLLNIIGVSADQSETAFTFTGKIVDYSNGASATPLGADWSVTCAGQGTFSRSAGKYVFFSGYCAGDVSASYCIQGKICEASKVATCGSSLTTCPTGVAPSAVYGRWALRYNEQASLQYWRDGTFSIPANIRR